MKATYVRPSIVREISDAELLFLWGDPLYGDFEPAPMPHTGPDDAVEREAVADLARRQECVRHQMRTTWCVEQGVGDVLLWMFDRWYLFVAAGALLEVWRRW